MKTQRKSTNLIDARNVQSQIKNSNLRSATPMADQKNPRPYWNKAGLATPDMVLSGFKPKGTKDPKPGRLKK